MNALKSGYSSLKALLILEAMSQSNDYVGIHDICQYTGYSQSTVHRILGEMLQCGFVEKNTSFKKYKIGMETVILASRFMNSNSIVAAARDELLALSRATSETVHLLSVTEYEVIYLDKIDTKYSLGLMSAVGKKNPIYCTAGGKAIAAFRDPSWIRDYLSQVQRIPFTQNTLVEDAAFLRELDRIRQEGYAIDDREHHEDILCVGAPIFDHTGQAVASISVSAPSSRFSLEDARSIAPLVMERAQSVSAKLGGYQGLERRGADR